jgi:hypothetical protein
VPFPRDWLGPLEELVPVGGRDPTGNRGVSATRQRLDERECRDESVAAPSASANLDDAAGGSTPPSAADFWSEQSVGLHHALQAPPSSPTATLGAADSAASVGSHRERGVRTGARLRPGPGGRDGAGLRWGRGLSLGRGVRCRRSVHPGRRVRWASQLSDRFQSARARRAIATLGAVLLGAVILAIAMHASGSSPRNRALSPSRVTTFATLVSGTEADLSAIRQIARHRYPTASRSHRALKRVSGHQHVTATQQTRHAASRAHLTTRAAPIRTVSPVSTAATASSDSEPATRHSGTPPEPAPPSATPVVTHSTPSSSTAATADSASQRAFGANGALGPGSSPNG